MPVRWSWKHKIGQYTLVQKREVDSGEIDLLTNEPKTRIITNKFTINIYEGNCLGICIYDYSELSENPEDTKPKVIEKYQFIGYWNDAKHLENMLGMHPKQGYGNNYYSKKDNPSDYIENIRLNMYFKDCEIIARRFIKAGFRVTLYYKVPKE